MVDIFPNSKQYHQATKNLFSNHAEEIDISQWPDDWITIFYKRYDRFLRIPLPKPESSPRDLFELLLHRETGRKHTGVAVSLLELSTWLRHVCGENEKTPQRVYKNRTYPSGGARYSIENYILVLKASEGLKSGVYHYRVDSHELELIALHDFSPEEMERLTWTTWLKNSAFLHVMTSVFWRSQVKYNERGYRFSLLEAGHIGQNAYLVSAALGLQCCALSGIYEDRVEQLIGVDGENESIVHAVAVGR